MCYVALWFNFLIITSVCWDGWHTCAMTHVNVRTAVRIGSILTPFRFLVSNSGHGTWQDVPLCVSWRPLQCIVLLYIYTVGWLNQAIKHIHYLLCLVLLLKIYILSSRHVCSWLPPCLTHAPHRPWACSSCLTNITLSSQCEAGGSPIDKDNCRCSPSSPSEGTCVRACMRGAESNLGPHAISIYPLCILQKLKGF